MPKNDSERLSQAIDSLVWDPFAGDIRKIEGQQNAWRRRVGSYRIFYDIKIEEKIVVVFRVARRTSQTY